MLHRWFHIALSSSLLICFVAAGHRAIAQNEFGSVEELKEEAQERFEKKDFVGAMPLYSQLLSHEPENPIYNYKYGVSALHGQKDKEKALKHLEYSAKKENVPPPVHYYLGLTHHQNYRFEEAISSYQRFKEEGDPDELPVERKLRMARNGKKLLKSPNELVVLDKTRTGTEEFFRYYEPEGVKGRILVAPEDIRMEGDEERDHKPLIFFPIGSKTIFYASYGEDGSDDKDIYQVKQLPNGDWAEPQKLKGEVNTDLDENYPFKPPDSRNLYFCSKGHNSMGGYDIFRSRYDPESQRFGSPKNLDFPINSPDDDLLYLADEANKVAYFASGRSSDAEHLHVYEVRIEKIPMQTAILKGRFKNEVDTSKKEARIVVKDGRNNQRVGVFNSSPDNGGYLITVPRSGEYKFIVQPEGSDYEHEGSVEVPELDEMRPLKQTLLLKEKNGQEQLVIKNRFEERFENEAAILSQVMKQKGELDVNDSETMRKKLEETEKKEEKKEKAGEEEEEKPVQEAEEEARELEAKAEKNEARSREAFAEAEKKKEEAASLNDKAQKRLEEAGSSSDPEVRTQKLEQADSLQREASKKADMARDAYEMGQELERKAEHQRTASERASSYAEALEKNLTEMPEKKALKATKKERKDLEEARKEAKRGASEPSSIRREAEELEDLADDRLQKGQKKRYGREKELKDRLENIEGRIENASGSEKEELKKERKSVRKEVEQVSAEADSAFAKAERLQERADRKASKASLLDTLQQKVDDERVQKDEADKKEWSPSEVEELQAEIDRTIETNRKKAEDPLLAQHRKSKKGENEKQKGKNTEKSEQEQADRDEEDPSGTKEEGAKSSDPEEEIDGQGFDPEEADPEVRKEIEKADPSFEKDLKALRENEDLSRKERRERIRGRKRELSKNLKERIRKKEQTLKEEDPEGSEEEELERSIGTLEKTRERLARDLEKSADERAESDEMGRPDTLSGALEGMSSSSREAIEKVDPDHEEEIENIRKNPELSNSEKQAAIREREDTLAERLEKGIEEREEQLEQSSDVEQEESLSREIEKLREARSELQAEREEDDLAKAKEKESEAEERNADEEESSGEERGDGGRHRTEEDVGEGAEEDPLAEEAGAEGQEEPAENESSGTPSTGELSSELNEEERALLDEEAPAYRQEFQEISSSDRAEAAKDLERAERTQDLVETLDERIREEQAALRNEDDPEALQERTQRIDRLEQLRNKKQKEAERYRRRAAGEDLVAEGEQQGESEAAEKASGTEVGSRERGRSDRAREESENARDQENSLTAEELERTVEEVDPDYSSDMESIEEEEEKGSRSYFREKASRAKQAREELEEGIDSLTQKAEQSEDPQERKRIDQKLRRHRRAKEKLAARERSYRAHGKEESDTQEGKKATDELRQELEKDLQALQESDLPEEKKKRAERQRRENALQRIDRSIEAEERIRDKSEGAAGRRAEERIQALRNEREKIARNMPERESGAEEGTERTSREKTREKVERSLEREAGTEEERRQIAQEKADEAHSFAREQEADAARLRKSLEKSSEEEGESEEEQRKRLQAMVLEEKADSARETAQAYEAAAADEEASEEEDEVSGEVVAVEEDGNGQGGEDAESSPGEESSDTGEESRDGSDERRDEEKSSDEEGSEPSGTRSESGEQGGSEREEGSGTDRTESEEEEGTESREGSEEDEEGSEIAPLSEDVLTMDDPRAIGESQGSIFEETEGSPYSKDRPIPKDPSMPEGVIYQVQVGAFRSDIPEDHFTGFAPLIGKTGDDGITRYRAGFFRSREKAREARDAIRGKGYSDAFVVAYEGGEEIDPEEAERRASDAVASKEEGTSGEESTSGTSSNSVGGMDGLFFTVQVGVFSDPLEEGEALQNIGSLYVKRTANGNYRYSTGVFTSVDEAREKNEEVAERGVEDAFITAYYDGERVTIERARELIGTKGEGVLRGEEGAPGERKEDGGSSGKSQTEDEASEEESAEEESPDPTKSEEGNIKPEDIVIKVDLGTYEGNIPNEVAEIILNSSGEGIEEREPEEGKTNYRTASYETLEAANRTRRKFVKKGIEQAEIITLVDGERIPTKQAARILRDEEP